MLLRYRLSDILSCISIGVVKDGDIFENSLGERLIYKDGLLSWVTIGGYVSSPVSITDESINETYMRLDK